MWNVALCELNNDAVSLAGEGSVPGRQIQGPAYYCTGTGRRVMAARKHLSPGVCVVCVREVDGPKVKLLNLPENGVHSNMIV